MARLLVVGTYSQKLGHVHGKGKGLYVLRLDGKSLSVGSVEPEESLFGRPQLGLLMANPTYMLRTAARTVGAGAPRLLLSKGRQPFSGG